MPTSRTRKPKPRVSAKTAPDPKILLPRLRDRLDKERASLERWRQRLFRASHAYERQHRLTARLGRRIAKLEGA
jgi:hypothetical protein